MTAAAALAVSSAPSPYLGARGAQSTTGSSGSNSFDDVLRAQVDSSADRARSSREANAAVRDDHRSREVASESRADRRNDALRSKDSTGSKGSTATARKDDGRDVAADRSKAPRSKSTDRSKDPNRPTSTDASSGDAAAATDVATTATTPKPSTTAGVDTTAQPETTAPAAATTVPVIPPSADPAALAAQAQPAADVGATTAATAAPVALAMAKTASAPSVNATPAAAPGAVAAAAPGSAAPTAASSPAGVEGKTDGKADSKADAAAAGTAGGPATTVAPATDPTASGTGRGQADSHRGHGGTSAAPAAATGAAGDASGVAPVSFTVAADPATRTDGVSQPAVTVVAPVAAPQAPTRVEAPAPVLVPVRTDAVPLAQQLAPSLQNVRSLGNGQHVMTIEVAPEHLGPVRVTAHISPDGVRIELVGATPEARDALKQSMSDLKRDLAGSGLQADLSLGSGSAGSGQQPGDDAQPGFGPRAGSTAFRPAGTAAAVDVAPPRPVAAHAGSLDLSL